MQCISCREVFNANDFGMCRTCYETIDDLKAKVSCLRLCPLVNPQLPNTNADLLLYGVSKSHDEAESTPTPAVPAHRAILINRSPVFKAMLETEMKENKSSMIKMYNVSYKVLHSFVNYLYTAEASLDEQMACDLLILAEKYQVEHLKSFCEKFLTSKLTIENVTAIYVFAHQYNAEQLIEAALSLIKDNIFTVIECKEFKELKERDPRLVLQIYEEYFHGKNLLA